MQFEQKTLSKIQWNPFDMIGKQWYLLTAGGLSDYNTMTASWGFMGEMWGKPSFLCGVRTNRHTLPFMEQNDCFSVQRCSSVARIPAEITTRQRKQV